MASTCIASDRSRIRLARRRNFPCGELVQRRRIAPELVFNERGL
jgi:hypothetical protein